MNHRNQPSLPTRLRTWLWLRKARRRLHAGDHETAAAWCEAVLELDRSSTTARQLLEEIIEAAVADGRRRMASGALDLPVALTVVGWFLEAEEYAEAAALLRKIQRAVTVAGGRIPWERELMHLRGRVSFHLGCHRRALEELTRTGSRGAGDLAPENLYYRGLCFLALGEHLQAVACFERLAEEHGWAITQRFLDLIEERSSGAPHSQDTSRGIYPPPQ